VNFPIHDTHPSPAEIDLGGYRLEDQVGFYLRKAGQRHGAIFARRMEDDLTPTQWAALVKIAEVNSISQNRLGRETAMDAATIKGVVDRLLRRGLVSTQTDPLDSRRNLIGLTEKGRELVALKLPVASALTEETLTGLSPQERKSLLELLRRIA
jgi:MarR family transcriptional regulator, lower aerobic nicotinate degradation pathway regulator